MTKKVDFYFDYGSPATYLAWTQIDKIIKNANAELNMIPMLLGGVFKETGNSSPAFIPAKSKWMNKDLKKHAQIYGVDYNSNSFFPINTLNLMRGAIAARKMNIFEQYSEAIFTGIWVKDVNLGDIPILQDYLNKNGIDTKELFITSNVVQNISQNKTEEISIIVKKAKGIKCSRCWKIVTEVQDNKCSRCSKIK